ACFITAAIRFCFGGCLKPQSQNRLYGIPPITYNDNEKATYPLSALLATHSRLGNSRHDRDHSLIGLSRISSTPTSGSSAARTSMLIPWAPKNAATPHPSCVSDQIIRPRLSAGVARRTTTLSTTKAAVVPIKTQAHLGNRFSQISRCDGCGLA